MKDQRLDAAIFGDHDDPDGPDGHHSAAEVGSPPPQTRREARAQAEAERRAERAAHGGATKGRPSLFRRISVIVLALALIGGGVLVAVTYLKPVVAEFFESNDYAGPGTGTVTVTVPEGAGGAAIAKVLLDEGVVKSSKAFVEAVKADPRSAGIQPGVYDLKQQMRAQDALAILVDPANRVVNRVVVPEGKWASETYAILAKATGFTAQEFADAAKDSAALGLPASAKGKVEGYLFPAAYEFAPDAQPVDMLAQMVSESTKRLKALGIEDKDMERTMVVASLVEAEARLDGDRAKVARVIENRVAQGMRLEFDSTVNYAAGKRSVTTSDAERASTSPYNTYQVTGLPPGPISNPGESAIKAAAAPAAGPWLFFVTVDPGTGETRFATTYEEHLKNVELFQAWCQANKGKC